MPPTSGPNPKPSEIALELTPNTVAWMMLGVSNPTIAPSAGITDPLTKLAATKATITRVGVPASAVAKSIRPISAAAPVMIHR